MKIIKMQILNGEYVYQETFNGDGSEDCSHKVGWLSEGAGVFENSQRKQNEDNQNEDSQWRICITRNLQ